MQNIVDLTVAHYLNASLSYGSNYAAVVQELEEDPQRQEEEAVHFPVAGPCHAVFESDQVLMMVLMMALRMDPWIDDAKVVVVLASNRWWSVHHSNAVENQEPSM